MVYVPLICSESPPLLSRAVCVLKITHAVYYFAKEKEKKSIVNCTCDMLHTAPSEQFGYKQRNSGYWAWEKFIRGMWGCSEHLREHELPGLGREGKPISRNKAVMLHDSNFYSCVHLLKWHILRKKGEPDWPDLVMCLLLQTGPVTGGISWKIPMQVAILLLKGKVAVMMCRQRTALHHTSALWSIPVHISSEYSLQERNLYNHM